MSRPRSVIGGARHKADITLRDPTDYFPYLPLRPRVAAGILEPRRVTTLTYDRLVLAVGGVNKLLPVPDPYVQVPGRPEAYACGDAAAPLGIGRRRAHRHRDLGFTIGLGGAQAAANPLGIPLSGPSPGPSPAALDTAWPEPARAAGSPGDFASRPEGES
ncbi:hypothetical protein ACFWB6_07915 [Streptomyces mirabilis]|uniref:hypothetical protein n=1 Tax=Streptomyces mirabilis TaxID=68239 RepID=UPI00332185D3